MKTETPLLLNIQITATEAAAVLSALNLSARRCPALAAEYLLAARSIEIELKDKYGIPAAAFAATTFGAARPEKEGF